MIISVAKFDPKNPYPTHFKCIEVRTAKDLASIMTSAVWSPICWINNQRKSDDFYCSDFLVLDYDDGDITLEEAVAWAQKYCHVIGTTKNHQKEKNGVVCDRFRVAVPWETRIEDLNTYRQNMERILSNMGSDQACKDGGRLYQPCTKIVSIGPGEKAKWWPYEAPKPRDLSPSYYELTKTIPPWLQDMMVTQPPEGMRNKTAYKIAYYLARYGFSEQECRSAVFSAPIDLPDNEKRLCARSGFLYGKQNPR